MPTSPKVGLDALLTPENCVVLLIDHQPSQLANVNSHDPTMVINNVTALAKVAKAFDVPTILTTIGAARGGGVHFVYIKSTEGKDYIDPNFHENWRGAQAAGIARGAYHFMTWCSLASEQARWFKRNVPNDADALPPVLDLEWNNHSSCKNKFNRADVIEKVRVMLAEMERHTGKVPIIYTDMNFYNDILAGEQFDSSFWLRSTAAEPHTKYGDRPWIFWQWTQTGTMSGIRTEVDRNAFYGSEGDWVTVLLTGCDPRAVDRLGPQGRCQSHK